MNGNQRTVTSFLKILWLGFPFSLLVGNLLGILEVFYLRFQLKILTAAGTVQFVQYILGGAFLYGLIFSLTFGLIIFLFGAILVRDLTEDPIQRMLGICLAIFAGVFSFLITTYTVYYDIPGLVETLRFPNVWLLSAVVVGSVYWFVRWLPLPPVINDVQVSNVLFWWTVPLILLNIAFGLGSFSLFYPKLPPVRNSGQYSGTKPPVIFIGVDTLRADHLRPYNSKLPYRSPAASQLTEDGVVYLNHSAQWPKTTPSFASIFTSLYPAEIPVYGNSRPIPKDRTTLAEILKKEGYYTLGVASSFAVHEKYLGQGFDYYLNRENWGLKNLKLIRYLLQGTSETLPTSYAIRFIRSEPPNQFFLFLHYIIPHAPYHPPYPYSINFDPDYSGQVSGDQRALSAIRSGRAYRNERDLRHVRQLYKGEVAFTDREIKRFLQVLKNEGLYRKALILYGSDHGETMDQHGPEHYFKHSTLYQSDLDVPLIIKYPNNKEAGQRVSRPTSNLDVLPTVLKSVGVEVPESRGESLRKQPERKKPVFSQKKGVVSLRTGRWKAIYRFGEEALELYDLESDPGETKDMRAQYPERSAQFRRRLKSFAEKTYRQPENGNLSERERQRLKGLGYLN